jgi:glycosyltransferase involved in cell wall biosynthesis
VQNTPAFLDYEVIVVDNGSTDGTPLYLVDWQARNPTKHRVMLLEKNTGFSLASNLGAENAKGDFLVLLNNDTEVEEGWLSALQMGLRRPRAGIVGPKLVFPATRTINHAGYTYNMAAGGFYPIYLNYPESAEPVCYDRRYQAILGACMLMRRDLFLGVGGFGDFGLEDIDLCFKVREAGFDIWYCHESVVLHHGSVTIKNTDSGLVPLTDLEEFNRRWTAEWFREDDEDNYRQDGFSRIVLSRDSIQLTDYRQASNELLDRALHRVELGEVDGALSDFQNALKIFPRNKAAVVGLAEFYRGLGEEHLAIQYLEEFIDIDPSFFPGASMLYRIYGSLYLEERKTRLISSLADYYYGVSVSLVEEQLRNGGPLISLE